MNVEQTELKPGTLIPDFHLVSAGGGCVHPSGYHDRKNLVLLFAGNLVDDELTRRFLLDLARHYPELVQENAEVLAVIRGSEQDAGQIKDKAGFPFPVLADTEGKAHLAAGASIAPGGRPYPAVFITDRFNEISAIYRTSQGEPLPTIREILSHLLFIETQCPE
ncbi:MAG: redoxin domain-containing protein [bacterium]